MHSSPRNQQQDEARHPATVCLHTCKTPLLLRERSSHCQQAMETQPGQAQGGAHPGAPARGQNRGSVPPAGDASQGFPALPLCTHRHLCSPGGSPQPAPREMLQNRGTNPDSNGRSHRHEREKIKPRLCTQPRRWAACVILQIAAPARPRSIFCLFSQFLSSKPGQLERKGVKKQKGGEGKGGWGGN